MDDRAISKASHRIEVLANCLIIVVGLLIVGVIAKTYVFKGDSDRQARTEPTVGQPLKLKDEDWAVRPKTVVLALQTTCHFCNESAPFYKRLVEYTKDKNIKIVAVFPQPVEESTAHLNQLGLSGMEVRQAPISDFETSGTPTLLLTNNKGEVTDYWIGKLSSEKETEVLRRLDS